MACLNITSLPKHIDELRILLDTQWFDILAINETRLNDIVSDDEVDIRGYNIIRQDRNRNGGGVCIYIRTNIIYAIRSDLKSKKLESLSIEVQKPRSKPFVITTWYRPPNSPAELFQHFENLIGKVDTENTEHIILGDFNCDFMPDCCDSNYNELRNISDIYNLTQLIESPTRVTLHSSSLIDLIFTNRPDRVVCSGVAHLGISDHSLIYVYRKLSIPSESKGDNNVRIRYFNKFDSDLFRNDIQAQPWDDILKIENPNDIWIKWKFMFLKVCDKHAPTRTRRIRKSKSPWISAHLKDLMHHRDRLKIKAIKSKDSRDWSVFRKTRNRVNAEIRNAKKSYYNNTFDKYSNNPRKTWQTINEVTSRVNNKSVINEIDNGGRILNNPTEVAEEFNQYFAEIGPELAKNIQKVDICYKKYLCNTEKQFLLKETNSSAVFALLSRLCRSKATGLDNISAKLLRECPDLISISLTHLFNQSIKTGILPDEWKSARVTPLYKNAGKRNDMTNYRPISIVPVVAKVFERIIYDQLYEYLNDNKLLSSCQSGFRSIHSTVTALLEATDNWSLNIDRGNINAVVFLDLKKAFDTVDHNILLSKLEYYGITGLTLNWFNSYLNNRTQTCTLNNCTSSKALVRCGVPQGTILGPLLFLLYINDLPKCLIYSQPRMYADDTSITFASNDINRINECVSSDLCNIHNWLSANKLTLNMTKTEFLLIGSNQRLSNIKEKPNILIEGEKVQQVFSSKSLGVQIDQHLTWENHISMISKKIASGISAIKRIRYFVPREILLTVYNALVQPHFNYCSIVWGNCNKGLSQKLQKLQNRAARIITFSGYDVDTDGIFKSLNWKKLDHQRMIDKCIFMYKTLNRLTPAYLTSKFIDRNDTTSYSLRNSENKLAVPQPHTEYFKRSFSYSGAVLWNKLPLNMRQASSLTSFKSQIRCHTF